MRLLIAHQSRDEQAILAEAVKPLLEDRCEILVASDGEDALELLLEEDPPELALVDWDLPGVDGPEMCRLVRDFQHHHDTHLIVLAGAGHADTSEAWRAGADDCVIAPARASELRARAGEGLRAMRAPEARNELAGPAMLEAVLTCERDDGSQPQDVRPTLDAVLGRS